MEMFGAKIIGLRRIYLFLRWKRFVALVAAVAKCANVHQTALSRKAPSLAWNAAIASAKRADILSFVLTPLEMFGAKIIGLKRRVSLKSEDFMRSIALVDATNPLPTSAIG